MQTRIFADDEVLLPHIDFARGDFPNLHELMAELRSHGTVVPVMYAGERVWLICGYRDLRAAMADEEHFMMATAYREHAMPVMGHTMETMTGEEHRINRGLISRSFLPSAVRRLVESLMEPVLQELLDELRPGSEVDLMKVLIHPYPFRVITRLLGIPVDDEEKFQRWADLMIQHAWNPEGAMRAKHEFTEYLAPIVTARRESPQDDLISVLVQANFEGQYLDDEGVYSFCRLLFPSGADTTYLSYGSLTATILSDDKWRSMACGSATDIEALVEEGLRMEPAAAMIPRRCSKDTVLGGQQIYEGDRAIFGIAAANRDPNIFDDAQTFRPGRDQKHLAFSNGIHVCLGQHFARAELQVGIRLLFQRFPDVQLKPDFQVRNTGAIVRGPKEIQVKL